jgi:two-component system cell cycle response regulator
MKNAVSHSEPAPSRGRVLVVDDSRLVRAMVANIVRNGGFEADEAEDGGRALALLATKVYDVVITDLNMPGMDGFEVLAGVHRASPNVEVIVLTGALAQDVSCAVRALRLGAHDYLAKPPANPDQVLLTVERALEKKMLKDANQRLVRELESLSRKDALTGVLNRRCFDEALSQEVARAKRHGQALGVVMLDIDHFKAINDTHGHPGGDHVLRWFARTVKAALREGDTLFRYGGEEFAVLLPHADGEGVLAAARRIVDTVAGAPIHVDGKAIRVTTSAGAACLDARTGSGESLVAGADRALYDAKKAGRNRAAFHGRQLALVGGRRAQRGT